MSASPLALSVAARAAESKSRQAGLRLRFATLRLSGVRSWTHANESRSKASRTAGWAVLTLWFPEGFDTADLKETKELLDGTEGKRMG
jgi:hypothetical protein